MGEAKRKRAHAIHRAIAYHEAGHAVVARTLGLQINDIRDNCVQTYSEGLAAKDGTTEDRIAGYEKDAKTAMAGMIAQHQVWPLHRDQVRHQTDDMKIIWSRLGRITLLRSGVAEPDLSSGDTLTDETADAAISIASQLWAETQSMVKASWPAIEQVAGLMLRQDRTTQADVDRAMQSAGDGVTAVFNELPFASFVSGSPIIETQEDEPTT
jgi:hypothetical protein